MIRSGVLIGDRQNCLHWRLNNFGLIFAPSSPKQRTVRNSILDKIVAADPTALELKISIVIFAILVRFLQMQHTSTAVEFVEIPSNENQNFFVRTIVVIPTIHLSPFSLLQC